MSLWNTINKVCRDLPKGFQINICMENGSAWIECYDDQGTELEFDYYTGDDRNLQYELNEVLNKAIDIHKEFLT